MDLAYEFEREPRARTAWLLPAGLGTAALSVMMSLAGQWAPTALLMVLSAFAFGSWFGASPRLKNSSVPDRIRWALGISFLLAGISIGSGALFFSMRGLPSAMVSLAVLGIGGAFAVGALLVLVRDLAFVRQTRGTRRAFALLVIAATLTVMAGPQQHEVPSFRNSLSDALTILTVLFTVVIGFRQSWIHYLTRRQKIAAFWSTLLTAILAGSSAGDTAGWDVFRNAAPFQTGIRVAALVGTIYFGMACLALLLSLPAARAYDRRSKGLASLQRLSEMVSSIFDVDRLIRTIPKLAADVTEGDAAWLELRQNGRLRVVSSVGMPSDELEGRLLNLEDGASGWILRTGQTILSQQVHRDPRVADLRNVQRRWQSVIGVPVTAHDRRLGVLYVARYEAFGFEPDDCELLLAFGNQSAVAIENASLVRESIEKQRLEEEFRVAREAQRKLLPEGPLRVGSAIFDGVCLTANEVGGDYYDFFPIDERRVAVVIADVAGKGASAAFYMAETKGVIETLARVIDSPREVLSRANLVLSRRMDRRTFISLIYAVIDVDAGRVKFARAGHCPLIHVMRDGTVRFLEPKGAGIGLVRGPEYVDLLEDMEFSVLPGESVFLFTDGLTEAMNSEGEEFGEGRVSNLLAGLRDIGIPQLKEGLIREVKNFVGPKGQRHDDMTFVIIRFDETDGGPN